MLVDSHCHLDFPDFAPELDDVVGRARAAGVGTMLTISTHVRRFERYAAIASAYPDVWCSVGTHPHHAAEEPDVSVAELVALSAHRRCVAIGEAGLDYHYGRSPPDVSAAVFRTHIAAARQTGLPLVIHSRDAYADMARNPMGRVGAMHELCNLAVFLMGPGAEYVNGQTIAIDGAEYQSSGGNFSGLRAWSDEHWKAARDAIQAQNAKDRAKRTV
jgi:hypothetical protein